LRVLILTCATGQGHNACAHAIQQVFLHNGVVCDVEDALRFTSQKFAQFMSWGHTTMYRHVPWLFDRGYNYAQDHQKVLKEDTAVHHMLTAGIQRLHDCILHNGYDTLICTHVFSGLLVAQMKKEFHTVIRTAFVATDYTCSPGAAATDADVYFIADSSLTDEFAAQGVPREKISAVGIPVDTKFYSCCDRELAKNKVGVQPSHGHLLLMCGSMGCGPMEELTKEFMHRMDKQTELSIVCGTNEKLLKKLDALCGNDERIHLYGFTNDIDTLMDSADIYITKPGGLSTTEAAAKGVPMVLIDAVAGCETPNMEFFFSRGGALTGKTPTILADMACVLLDDPLRRQVMRENLRFVCNGNAAQQIYDILNRK